MFMQNDELLLEELGFGAGFKDEIIEMLDSTQMFNDFSGDDINLLSEYLHAYSAKTGAIIYHEGERAGHVCILVKGKLEVLKSAGLGEDKKLADVRSGKSIGEMSIIDGMPNSATVTVSAPSTLLLLTKNNLLKVTSEHPVLGVKLLWHFANLLSQRLRQTSGKLIDYL